MRRLLPTTLVVLAGACAKPARPTSMVADSAGIRIVTNSGPSWAAGAEWSVSPGASLKVPASREGKGPGEFEYLSWVQACGGDSVFALDNASRRLDGVRLGTPSRGPSRPGLAVVNHHAG